MTELPMLAAGIFMNFVAVLFVLVSVVLILVILIQKGRGGGLSGAFGGGMAGSLLGSKTGDFLTWVTIVLVAVFLLLAVVLARFYRPAKEDYGAGSAQVTSSSTTGQPEAPAAAGAGAEAMPGELGTDVTTEPAGETPAAPAPVAPVEPNTAGG